MRDAAPPPARVARAAEAARAAARSEGRWMLPILTAPTPGTTASRSTGSRRARSTFRSWGAHARPWSPHADHEDADRIIAAVNATLVIPALNEAGAIGDLVRRVPAGAVREVIVVDNGSTDATAVVAASAGARVVREPRRGYGAACWAGVSAVSADTDVVAFLDGDGSQSPEELPKILEPIAGGRADFALAARRRPDGHPPHATLGTPLIPRVIARRPAGRGPPVPRSLYVETTSRCNSKCQTCILTFGGREPAEDLTWPRFRQIVDQFPALERVLLHGIGEPLLNPDLPRMIEHLVARGAHVLFNSNAISLSRVQATALIDAGLHELRVSVDASTRESYARVRGAG